MVKHKHEKKWSIFSDTVCFLTLANWSLYSQFLGFPVGTNGKEATCQCRRHNALLQCGRPGFDPWVVKIRWRRERLPTPVFWPGEFHGLYSPWGRKNRTQLRNFHFQWKRICLPSRRHGFDPWVGKIVWRRNQPTGGNPLQYSGLENSMDYIVHGVARSRTWLSNFHFYTFPSNLFSTSSSVLC